MPEAIPPLRSRTGTYSFSNSSFRSSSRETRYDEANLVSVDQRTKNHYVFAFLSLGLAAQCSVSEIEWHSRNESHVQHSRRNLTGCSRARAAAAQLWCEAAGGLVSGPPAEPAAASPDSRRHADRRSPPPSVSLVAAAVAPLGSSRVKPAAAYTKDVSRTQTTRDGVNSCLKLFCLGGSDAGMGRTTRCNRDHAILSEDRARPVRDLQIESRG